MDLILLETAARLLVRALGKVSGPEVVARLLSDDVKVTAQRPGNDWRDPIPLSPAKSVRALPGNILIVDGIRLTEVHVDFDGLVEAFRRAGRPVPPFSADVMILARDPAAISDRQFMHKRRLGLIPTLPQLGPEFWGGMLPGDDPNDAASIKMLIAAVDGGASGQAAEPPRNNDAEAVYGTGLPGRPTSWQLIEPECQRRYADGERHAGKVGESVTKWADVLIEWLGSTHPNAPHMGKKSVRNRLSPLLRELQSQAGAAR